MSVAWNSLTVTVLAAAGAYGGDGKWTIPVKVAAASGGDRSAIVRGTEVRRIVATFSNIVSSHGQMPLRIGSLITCDTDRAHSGAVIATGDWSASRTYRAEKFVTLVILIVNTTSLGSLGVF